MNEPERLSPGVILDQSQVKSVAVFNAYIASKKPIVATFASSGIIYLFELGWPLAKIQGHARHKDPKTTQIYFSLWSQQKHSSSRAQKSIIDKV